MNIIFSWSVEQEDDFPSKILGQKAKSDDDHGRPFTACMLEDQVGSVSSL